MAVTSAYITVHKTICSSALELGRTLCLNMTAFLTLAALHVLGTRLIEMLIDSPAMPASFLWASLIHVTALVAQRTKHHFFVVFNEVVSGLEFALMIIQL